MLNPNALRHHVMTLTACQSQDRAVLTTPVRSGSGAHYMQIFSSASCRSPILSPTFLTCLAVCSITHCTDIKKSHIQNTKRDHMNVKQGLKSPLAQTDGMESWSETIKKNKPTSYLIWNLLPWKCVYQLKFYIHHRIHILWFHHSTCLCYRS